MKITKSTETQIYPCIIKRLADIPGGVTLMIASLKALTTEVKAGAVIGEDASNLGQYHLTKTAKLHADATNTATTYQVKKEHELKVGDIITTKDVASCKAYAITVVDTTTGGTVYDILTVGTTLGVAMTAANVVILLQVAAQDTSGGVSVPKYPPKAIIVDTVEVVAGASHFVGAMTFGQVKESLLPFYVNSDLKTRIGDNIKFL